MYGADLTFDDAMKPLHEFYADVLRRTPSVNTQSCLCVEFS